jgi:hypothetical protein
MQQNLVDCLKQLVAIPRIFPLAARRRVFPFLSGEAIQKKKKKKKEKSKIIQIYNSDPYLKQLVRRGYCVTGKHKVRQV